MNKINDERDILKEYLQKIYSIDSSIKDDNKIITLGPRINLISEACTLPLSIKSLDIPYSNSLKIPLIIHKLHDIEYLSVSTHLLY